MVSDYYPELDTSLLTPIRCVFEAMADDPLWLERAACPYDKDVREGLRELWVKLRAPKPKVERVEVSGEDKWGSISEELVRLFDELRNYSSGIEEEDNKERMAYFRTATSLLDKIVSTGERAQNVKAVSDFQARVIAVFDEVLTPEQRTIAMEMLG